MAQALLHRHQLQEIVDGHDVVLKGTSNSPAKVRQFTHKSSLLQMAAVAQGPCNPSP